jgi:hypothetical protein
VTTLPRETLEVYEVKGRLLSRIEAMNKVGKIVFWNESDIAGLFNKDVPKRARKSRKNEETSETTETSS